MQYKKGGVKSCSNCHYATIKLGVLRGCEFILMTGRSRVAMGIASDKPYRPCKAWMPRKKAEREEYIKKQRAMWKEKEGGRENEE
jgi:hypothetical protein